MMSSTVAVYSFQFGFRSLLPSASFFFRFFFGFSSFIKIKICRHEVTKRNKPMQVFAPRIYSATRNCQLCVYTYSSKRSRTRTPSAFATSCKRPTVTSRRPFIQLFTVCRLTSISSANSASLTFFSSSLCADSAATHTFVFSFCLLFKMLYKIAPLLVFR